MRSEDDWSRLDDDGFALDEDYPDLAGEQLNAGRDFPPSPDERFV